MPIEVTLLRDAEVTLARCPSCLHKPFKPFMRGQVQRWPHRFPWFPIKALRRDYCALICESCKDIVGYESPPTETHL